MDPSLQVPDDYRCGCPARVRICTGKDYIRLEFHGTHDETSHAKDYSKTLSYKQIATIHDEVFHDPLPFTIRSSLPLYYAAI